MNKKTIPVIAEIESLVEGVAGWSPIDQLFSLFSIAYFTKGIEGDILELGSWCGRSALALGLAAQYLGDTKVVCGDLFPEKNDWKKLPDGTYAFDVTICGSAIRAPKVHTIWQEPYERDIVPIYEKYNGIFEAFSENIRKSGLEALITGYKTDSEHLKEFISEDQKFKLAFIDGDHTYEAVCNDIRNVEPLLVSGGWICFDDAFVTYDGVSKAITDLIIDNPTYEMAQQVTRKLFVARKK